MPTRRSNPGTVFWKPEEKQYYGLIIGPGRYEIVAGGTWREVYEFVDNEVRQESEGDVDERSA